MIKRLFAQVVETISSTETVAAEDREAALRLATAVLMVDVARADYVFEESEFNSVLSLMETHFGLSPEQAAELLNLAGNEADELVEVHRFTQLLHEHLSDDEKARIVSLLWQIAYADGQLDKYEDYFVRKIAELLHVRHGAMIQAKHRAAAG